MILSRINSKSIGGKVSEKTVLIHKGQHRTEAYLKLNPLGQIPCLVKRGERPDGASEGPVEFSLPESCAILRHLCEVFGLDAWYPSCSGTGSLAI